MMLPSVPILSSLWSGTITVTVEVPTFFCNTMWLPCRRTISNAFFLRMSQHSLAESRRSLANRYLDASHEHLTMEALFDLGRHRCFKEQSQGFA